MSLFKIERMLHTRTKEHPMYMCWKCIGCKYAEFESIDSPNVKCTKSLEAEKHLICDLAAEGCSYYVSCPDWIHENAVYCTDDKNYHYYNDAVEFEGSHYSLLRVLEEKIVDVKITRVPHHVGAYHEYIDEYDR